MRQRAAHEGDGRSERYSDEKCIIVGKKGKNKKHSGRKRHRNKRLKGVKGSPLIWKTDLVPEDSDSVVGGESQMAEWASQPEH